MRQQSAKVAAHKNKQTFSTTMNFDWPELSIIIAALFSNIIVAYVTHVLTKRREQEKNKKNVIVSCKIMRITGNWYTSSIAEEDFDGLVLYAVNDSHRPITITEAGFILGNGISFRPSNYPAELWETPIVKNDGEIARYIFRITDLRNVMQDNNSIVISAYVSIGTGERFTVQVDKSIIERLNGLL